MRSPHKRSRRLVGRSAFSLVESVLALGIVAFVMVPVFALLPIGLTASRNSADATAGARIAQQITGEALLGTATLPAHAVRYFDLLGQENLSTTAATDLTTIYYTNVVTTTGFNLPGEGVTTSRDLTRIDIQNCYNPYHRALTMDANNRVVAGAGDSIREYSLHISP